MKCNSNKKTQCKTQKHKMKFKFLDEMQQLDKPVLNPMKQDESQIP